MSINRKNADGTYTEVAGVPYVTKENIGLGKVENKSPEELVAMSMDAINCVTPEQFGAVGNGETDDTVAFNNAIKRIEEAGGGKLMLANKVYAIGGTITVNGNSVCIEGQNNGDNDCFGFNSNSKCSVLKALSGTTEAVLKVTGDVAKKSYRFCNALKNFTINGNNLERKGIHIECNMFGTIENVNLFNFSEEALYMNEFYVAKISNLITRYCGSIEKNKYAVHVAFCQSLQFYACSFNNNYHSIYGDSNAYSIHFTNCYLEADDDKTNAWTPQIYLTAYTEKWRFDSSLIVVNGSTTKEFIHLESPSHVISGCEFQGEGYMYVIKSIAERESPTITGCYFRGSKIKIDLLGERGKISNCHFVNFPILIMGARSMLVGNNILGYVQTPIEAGARTVIEGNNFSQYANSLASVDSLFTTTVDTSDLRYRSLYLDDNKDYTINFRSKHPGTVFFNFSATKNITLQNGVDGESITIITGSAPLTVNGNISLSARKITELIYIPAGVGWKKRSEADA